MMIYNDGMKLAIILDNIRSVHNVGSIFRTADAAGVEAVYCCGITPGPLDRFKNVRPDFAKVALGAERSVAWKTVKDVAEAIAELQQAGWIVLAIEQSKQSVLYYDWKKLVPHKKDDKNIGPKIALAVGTEVEGLSEETLRLCDGILEIPMSGQKESLNVAVAFGIVVFAVRYGGKI